MGGSNLGADRCRLGHKRASEVGHQGRRAGSGLGSMGQARINGWMKPLVQNPGEKSLCGRQEARESVRRNKLIRNTKQ